MRNNKNNNNYNWYTWFFCCLFCNRDKYNNSASGSYYKYGKTYSQKSYKKLFN